MGVYLEFILKQNLGEDLGKFAFIGIIFFFAIISGVFLGNGAVYLFNKLPGKWLCDYDEEPSEELLHPTTQRIHSTPWKYVFTGGFIILAFEIGMSDLDVAVPVLLASWLLLEMSIADVKYMIVPDQLMFLLILTGICFIPFSGRGIKWALLGAGVALAVTFAMSLIGKLLTKKWFMGGADVKLFTILGFLAGLDGVAIIFVVSTVFSGVHFAYLLIRKKVSLSDHRPAIPYIAAAAILYLAFMNKISYNILVNL